MATAHEQGKGSSLSRRGRACGNVAWSLSYFISLVRLRVLNQYFVHGHPQVP
jgi:hypothetical protein